MLSGKSQWRNLMIGASNLFFLIDQCRLVQEQIRTSCYKQIDFLKKQSKFTCIQTLENNTDLVTRQYVHV